MTRITEDILSPKNKMSLKNNGEVFLLNEDNTERRLGTVEELIKVLVESRRILVYRLNLIRREVKYLREKVGKLEREVNNETV